MKKAGLFALLLAFFACFSIPNSKAQIIFTTNAHVIHSLPFTPCAGSPVQLTIMDTSGTYTTGFYSWYLGDGSYAYSNVYAPSITHTYTAPGTYQLFVTTYDSLSPNMDTTYFTLVVDSICPPSDLISGSVYYDFNSNNVQDIGEPKRPGSLIEVLPGPHYFSTNSLGEYAINLPAGSYSLNLQPIQYFGYGNPASGSLNVTSLGSSASNTGNDFGIVASGTTQDMMVYVSAAPPVPGFTRNFYVQGRNFGNTVTTGTVELEFDPSLGFISASAGGTNSGNTVSWNYTLFPGQSIHTHALLQVPANAVLGTTITSYARANPIAGDVTPANNVDTLSQIVIGSYDPNDKTATPDGDILPGTPIDYRIRFQNTGTFMATNVILRDTLSGAVDPLSLRVQGSSHPMTWHLSQNELVFEFLGIMLPDSNSNEPASHGWVEYAIDHVVGLPLGSTIQNTAAIFFDFNAPIFTNTTLNTLVSVLSITNVRGSNSVTVAPNPFSERTMLTFENPAHEAHSFTVMDLQGRSIFVRKGITASSFEVDLAGTPAGMYVFKMENAQGAIVTTGRLVAQ